MSAIKRIQKELIDLGNNHLKIVQLDQSMRMILTNGKQLSWDQMILHMLVEFSSLTSNFQWIIRSGRHVSGLLQKYIIQISA